MTTTSDRFDQALGYIAEELGLREMAFDDDGVCRLEVEHTFGVALLRDPSRNGLTLTSAMQPTLPEEVVSLCALELLGLSLLPLRIPFAPGLGWDDDAESLACFLFLPLGSFENEREVFLDLFKRFIEYVANLNAMLGNLADQWRAGTLDRRQAVDEFTKSQSDRAGWTPV